MVPVYTMVVLDEHFIMRSLYLLKIVYGWGIEFRNDRVRRAKVTRIYRRKK